jgi:hypothetical protein
MSVVSVDIILDIVGSTSGLVQNGVTLLITMGVPSLVRQIASVRLIPITAVMGVAASTNFLPQFLFFVLCLGASPLAMLSMTSQFCYLIPARPIRVKTF